MNNIKDLISKELDSYDNKPSIFIDESILTFDYLPKSLPHRDSQILELTRYFKGLFNQKVEDIFLRQTIILLGSLGTGKTSTAKRFGKDLEKISDQKIPYFKLVYRHFNCRTHRSINILLVDILKSILPYYPKRGFSASELIRDLFNTLETNNLYLVLTLDEIDYLFYDDKINILLYAFTRISDNSSEVYKQRISLVLITKNKDFVFLLDPTIKSSLAKNIINFPVYNHNEIKDILINRIKYSMVGDSISDTLLMRISEISAEKGGDARLALELLWRSAKIAESNHELAISTSHLRNAISSVISVNKEILADLTVNEILILLSIAKGLDRDISKFRIELSVVKNRFLFECEKNKNPINEHNLNIWPFIKKIYNYGLINIYTNNIPYKEFLNNNTNTNIKKTEISTDLPVEQLIVELETLISLKK